VGQEKEQCCVIFYITTNIILGLQMGYRDEIIVMAGKKNKVVCKI
jgi:hypothetical protein